MFLAIEIYEEAADEKIYSASAKVLGIFDEESEALGSLSDKEPKKIISRDINNDWSYSTRYRVVEVKVGCNISEFSTLKKDQEGLQLFGEKFPRGQLGKFVPMY